VGIGLGVGVGLLEGLWVFVGGWLHGGGGQGFHKSDAFKYFVSLFWVF
jgi:hypothetical protein